MIAASSDAAVNSVASAATSASAAASHWEDDGGTVATPSKPASVAKPAMVVPSKVEPEPTRATIDAAPKPTAAAAIPCASPDASPEEIWAAVRAAAAGNERLAAQIDKLTLEAISPQRVIIGHGARNKITAELALPQVQQILSKVLGRAVPVVLQQTAGVEQARLVRAPLDGAGEAASAGEAAPPVRAGPTPEVLAEVNHPLVVKAIELLGATVREVRTRQD